jgi:hypothetical protein
MTTKYKPRQKGIRETEFKNTESNAKKTQMKSKKLKHILVLEEEGVEKGEVEKEEVEKGEVEKEEVEKGEVEKEEEEKVEEKGEGKEIIEIIIKKKKKTRKQREHNIKVNPAGKKHSRKNENIQEI